MNVMPGEAQRIDTNQRLENGGVIQLGVPFQMEGPSVVGDMIARFSGQVTMHGAGRLLVDGVFSDGESKRRLCLGLPLIEGELDYHQTSSPNAPRLFGVRFDPTKVEYRFEI